MYTYRIEQAIRAAAVLHKDQLRKGAAPLPYVTHLYAVATIVGDYTDNEDTIIGALLHDTIEDTDYTADELKEDFGDNVKKIVIALSEPKRTKANKMTWKEQKTVYAEQLKTAPVATLTIVAADKIHNMRTIVEEYFDDYTRFLKDFPGSLDDRALIYQDISNVLNSRLKNSIISEFNHVYTEYKNFILDVKKSKK